MRIKKGVFSNSARREERGGGIFQTLPGGKSGEEENFQTPPGRREGGGSNIPPHQACTPEILYAWNFS